MSFLLIHDGAYENIKAHVSEDSYWTSSANVWQYIFC